MLLCRDVSVGKVLEFLLNYCNLPKKPVIILQNYNISADNQKQEYPKNSLARQTSPLVNSRFSERLFPKTRRVKEKDININLSSICVIVDHTSPSYMCAHTCTYPYDTHKFNMCILHLLNTQIGIIIQLNLIVFICL